MTQRRQALVTLGFFAAGAALAVTALPLRLPEVCLFKRVTGLPCCGCGMTHAFCAMARGHFAAAYDFNAAAIPLAFVLAIAALLLAGEAITNRSYLAPCYNKCRRILFVLTPPILLFAWVMNLARAFGY